MMRCDADVFVMACAGPLYVIVEYAEYGNLRDFVRRYRADFAARLQREFYAREQSSARAAAASDESTTATASDPSMSSAGGVTNSNAHKLVSTASTPRLTIQPLAQRATFGSSGAALSETNALYSQFSGSDSAGGASAAGYRAIPEADSETECAHESPIADEETEGLEAGAAMPGSAASFVLPDYEVPRSRRRAGAGAQQQLSQSSHQPPTRASGSCGPSPPVPLTYSLLLDIARQVADGMNYLSSRKVRTRLVSE